MSSSTETRHSPLRIAVLASGRGSNLAALIKAQQAGRLHIELTAVGSDQPHAPALDIAREHGIAAFALEPKTFPDRRSFDQALFARIRESGAQAIVLAGFMRILDGSVIAPWHGRMFNIHPSLLPRYPGLHTHRKVLAAGDAEHGASVHFVTAELDGGPVIAQARIRVQAGDTEENLAARLLGHEHQLFPAVLQLAAQKRLALTENTVILDGTALQHPLQLVDGQLIRPETTSHA